MSCRLNIVIIGGGAAGFFGAIRAAEVAREKKIPVNICILESTSNVLSKVRISGGGRCNVTHNCFDIKDFCLNYPRGGKELISPMHQFQARDTVKWFADRGVKLVAEEDGRMFPETNSSETIIECYKEEIKKLGVQILTKHAVQSLAKMDNGKIKIDIKDKPYLYADSILIATGSSKMGYRLASSLGNSITGLAPSLFSFKIQDILLRDLSGTSFESTRLRLKIDKKKNFIQEGPCLITHWGLSGPAVLKLSAWSAREMKSIDYKGKLFVNWLGYEKIEDLYSFFQNYRDCNSKVQIKNSRIPGLSKRFLEGFLDKLEISKSKCWSELPKKQFNKIIENLFSYEMDIIGKNRFKEEFVECGGVSLKEIDFKTMESKTCSGVYFAGEILDIDGITGGFNFQNAWTTSWIAGSHLV